jgi:hypothetical protein
VKYDFTTIPGADVPQAVEPVFQHVLQTYARETSNTVSVWLAVPNGLLDPFRQPVWVCRSSAVF